MNDSSALHCCTAPLRVLCEFQPARAAAQIVRLFAHPFNEHTWKAADIRCKYQGGNLFNISDYKRTECAKDFLVKLGVMISSPYIWAANDQKMAYSIEKATLLSRVDLDTAHGRSVVCECKSNHFTRPEKDYRLCMCM